MAQWQSNDFQGEEYEENESLGLITLHKTIADPFRDFSAKLR
jgi:hypothetical protein